MEDRYSSSNVSPPSPISISGDPQSTPSRSMSIHIITGATYSLIFLLTLWRYGYMTVHLSFTAAWKTGSLASCLYHIYDHLVVCLPIGILSTNHEVHKLVQQSSSNMRSKQIKSAIIFLIIISWARLFQHHYRQSCVAQCHCIVSEIIIRAYFESHRIGEIIKLGIVRIIPDKLIVEELTLVIFNFKPKSGYFCTGCRLISVFLLRPHHYLRKKCSRPPQGHPNRYM